MLNYFFGLSTYDTNNTLCRNNGNLGLDVSGCHGNWGVSRLGYFLRLTTLDDLDPYSGNEIWTRIHMFSSSQYNCFSSCHLAFRSVKYHSGYGACCLHSVALSPNCPALSWRHVVKRRCKLVAIMHLLAIDPSECVMQEKSTWSSWRNHSVSCCSGNDTLFNFRCDVDSFPRVHLTYMSLACLLFVVFCTTLL
jgi:hypothetical protein